VLVPFLFSFHPKLRFDKQFRFAFPAIVTTAILFVVWDVAMTRLGVWGFNDNYLTGSHVFNLPVEEVLFFVCIPFACLFTYHCLRVLEFGKSFKRYEKVISVALIVGLMTVGLLNVPKLYTSSTFLLLTLLVGLLQFVFRVGWLGHFYFAFVVLLIPFFIVNGILTGTGLAQPVVWYNDHENLGIRMLTIPVEDTFYGMLLQLTNVAFYESLRRRYASR